MLSNFNPKHTDLSTERGYQFEFHCMKCNQGKCSTIIPRKSAGLTSKLFGVFAGSSQQTDAAEKEEAFRRAGEEVSLQFKSCPGCSRWVCENCWDPTRGTCPDCVPKAETKPEPKPQAPVQARPEPQLKPAAKLEAKMPGPSAQSALPKLMTCPYCGAKAQTGKACTKCNNGLDVARRCKKCTFVVPAGKKFCLRCGSSQ